MFEKSLIGAYGNRLYDSKEKQDPFSCYCRIKANSGGKILMSQILMRKRAHQTVEHAYHQTAHFFMSQNGTPLHF